MPILATQKTCTGCAACIDCCPTSAISFISHSDGHLYPVVDEDKCIECKKCERTCPIVSNYSYGNNDAIDTAFAAWGKDTEAIRRSATGGIFYELAKYVLSSNGVVVGARMNGIRCEYALIDSEENLRLLQGSKYTYSNPEGIYKKIFDVLKLNKIVLFSGLPCHVGGILKFVPQKYHDNLYTIDLICGGVSSPILIDKYKECEDPQLETIVSFRDKSEGWKPVGYRYRLKTEDVDGTIKQQPSGTRNLITDGFACGLTNRHSCYDCKFAFLRRKSDLTIGDLWGDKKFKAHHRNGLSVVYVHSEKGLDLLKSSNIELNDIDPQEYLLGNKRLFVGSSIKGKLPERKFIGGAFARFYYSVLLKIYASDFKMKDLLWLPFAFYRYVSFKLDSKMIEGKAKKILSKIKR